MKQTDKFAVLRDKETGNFLREYKSKKGRLLIPLNIRMILDTLQKMNSRQSKTKKKTLKN